jgi:hypothetical protein
MIHTPRIFIGVLTHPRSSYSLDHTNLLSSNLNRAGIHTALEVCKENLIENSWTSITRRLAIVSAMEYGLLKINWYRNLPKKGVGAVGVLLALANLLKQLGYLLWPSGLVKTRASMIRLRNISLGHAGLWHQALQSESEWILMLEDDADPNNPTTLSRDLLNIIEHLEKDNKDSTGIFCDASLSYSNDELGIKTLGTPCLLTGVQRLYEVDKPFTNTLCAVLMSRSFVQNLSSGIHKYLENPKDGFLPIDWLVNKYLLETQTKPKSQSKFYKIQPGLYAQRSLQ